jgi:dTDP-4-amino-4,6-dideoxygalactose transaminase
MNCRSGGCLELPYVPEDCHHNAHMFYVKLKDLEQRTRMIDYLREEKIIVIEWLRSVEDE